MRWPVLPMGPPRREGCGVGPAAPLPKPYDRRWSRPTKKHLRRRCQNISCIHTDVQDGGGGIPRGGKRVVANSMVRENLDKGSNMNFGRTNANLVQLVAHNMKKVISHVDLINTRYLS